MLHQCRDSFPRRETAWLASAVRSPGPTQKLGSARDGVNAANGTWFYAVSICGSGGGVFFAAALHRGRYPHRLPVFRDGAPRDLDARLAQPLHEGVVGQDVLGALGIDQLLDAV